MKHKSKLSNQHLEELYKIIDFNFYALYFWLKENIVCIRFKTKRNCLLTITN